MTSPSAPAEAPGTVPGHPRLILTFLCLAGFMTFLDVSIVNVALPTIEGELGVAQSTLQYVVTTYGMTLGGFLLLAGRLADHFGRRRMLQAGLATFACTSLAAGLATDVVLLIIARGLQGLGAALIATAALSLLTSSFPEGPQRNRALGAWGSLSGVAAVAGVTLGGLLTDGPGWRWIFFVNVPIGLIGAALAPLVLPAGTTTQRRRTFDVTGAVVLTAGLVLLIFGLGRSVDETGGRWTSIDVLGSLVAAGVLLVAFVAVERRSAAPLIPLGVFRLPALRTANVIAVLLLGTVVSLFFFASLFLQQVMGYSPVEAGLAYLPLAVMTAVGAATASKLSTRMAAKPVLLGGLVLAAAGLLLLWRLPVDGSYVTDILPAFLLIGAGLGSCFVPVQIAALAGVEQTRFGGVAAGLINTSQEAGGALGLAVVASIAFRRVPELTAQAHGVPELVQAARASVFREAFLIGTCFLATAFVVAVALLPMLRTSRGPETAGSTG